MRGACLAEAGDREQLAGRRPRDRADAQRARGAGAVLRQVLRRRECTGRRRAAGTPSQTAMQEPSGHHCGCHAGVKATRQCTHSTVLSLGRHSHRRAFEHRVEGCSLDEGGGICSHKKPHVQAAAYRLCRGLSQSAVRHRGIRLHPAIMLVALALSGFRTAERCLQVTASEVGDKAEPGAGLTARSARSLVSVANLVTGL